MWNKFLTNSKKQLCCYIGDIHACTKALAILLIEFNSVFRLDETEALKHTSLERNAKHCQNDCITELWSSMASLLLGKAIFHLKRVVQVEGRWILKNLGCSIIAATSFNLSKWRRFTLNISFTVSNSLLQLCSVSFQTTMATMIHS